MKKLQDKSVHLNFLNQSTQDLFFLTFTGAVQYIGNLQTIRDVNPNSHSLELWARGKEAVVHD